MKRFNKALVVAALTLLSGNAANAQYYQLVDRATDILQTAITGGLNYRGTVECGYLAGIGNKRADFLDISTTHGFKYNNWFFMGLGLGVDVMFSTYTDANSYRDQYKQTSVMVPMYTDFRFNFGNQANSSVFIDVKVGAGFYVSDRYILVGDGYVNSRESFYLKPTVGMRIPLSLKNPKQAINLGASYQLLTNSYWYNPTNNRSVTLNALGVNISYEW